MPYLDVLMNLIIFVLLSLAGLGAWGVVKATLTAPAQAAATGNRELSVTVRADGFDVSAFGAPFIPLAGGAHDVEALGSLAATMKGSSKHIVIAAEPGIAYGTLVATMDALRPAFPDVALEVR